MMVAGKLEARGLGPDDIKFTLKEEIIEVSENDTEISNARESSIPVRLIGGRTSNEGRLQASDFLLIGYTIRRHIDPVRSV